jgi:hypothetical protein
MCGVNYTGNTGPIGHVGCPKCGSGMTEGPNQFSFYPDDPGWKINCEDCRYAVYGFTEEAVIKEWSQIDVER